MHHKEIKAQIRKQLESKYPNWKSLSRKEKRTISRSVLEQVSENYDFRNEVTAPLHELLGLEEQQIRKYSLNPVRRNFRWLHHFNKLESLFD